MKILISTDTYSPTINGVVASINNLYAELKNNKHDIKILTLSHSGEEKIIGDIYYLRSMGIKVYPDARIKFPFHNKLINEILNWKPDIIHSQTEFSTMLVAKFIANKLHIPQIHTYHTMYEDYLGYLLGGKIIKKNTAAKITKLLLNTLDGIITPSEKAKRVLLGYGVNKPIYTVPTGIDLSNFQKELLLKEKLELLKKLGIKDEAKIISYVGRIAEEKNIIEILLPLHEVINKFKNTIFLIVGGGPYLEILKKQVKKQHLEKNVIFTGMVKPEEVYKYYKLSQVFVTASTSETQGLTYIEALSSGCPVVCKYDNCIDGIVEHGKNGFTYKKQYELASYINKLLENTYLRNKMSTEAIFKAKGYSSDIFTKEILKVYTKILNISKEDIPFIEFKNSKAQGR